VLRASVSTLALRLAGWQVDGRGPAKSKYVCLATPHTSNWDGLLLVLVASAMDLRISWLIKQEWMVGPAGWLLRRLGAIPVNRRSPGGLVAQLASSFKEHDALVLVIPPEGTRGRAERWKSGFYRIAREAGVPVVPSYLDFGRRRAGLGPAIHLTGDVKRDMDVLRAFYDKMQPVGRFPGKSGPIRLREED
jgi:1-acyl-sn-glycerol-3-phosphate acyltransferase